MYMPCCVMLQKVRWVTCQVYRRNCQQNMFWWSPILFLWKIFQCWTFWWLYSLPHGESGRSCTGISSPCSYEGKGAGARWSSVFWATRMAFLNAIPFDMVQVKAVFWSHSVGSVWGLLLPAEYIWSGCFWWSAWLDITKILMCNDLLF